VGHVRKRDGGRRMRHAGDLSELRGREDRHEHRRNTAAILIPEYYLRALFRRTEIFDRPAGTTAEVRELIGN